MASLLDAAQPFQPAYVSRDFPFRGPLLCSDRFDAGMELIRKDESKLWGPANFEWVTVQRKIEKSHGKTIRAHGVEYPSLTAFAGAFGIGVSTLKDRLRRQGMTPEQAVSIPLSATSYRNSPEGIVVDAKVFRSKRQAILYLAKRREITEYQAKVRLARGDSE